MTAPRLNPAVPHPARVIDHLLGGKDYFAADRAAGDAMSHAIPELPVMVAEAHRFAGRVTDQLVQKEGIHQFLDIGTGLPTRRNLHEIAQSQNPAARVVYVDNDPMVLAHLRALMIGTPVGRVAVADADLRDPARLLAHPQLRATLDLTRPVGLTLFAVLTSIDNASDPWTAVAHLRDAMPSGTCLALTHLTPDFNPPAVTAAVAAAAGAGLAMAARSREQVARFFGDWEMLDPGLVPVAVWHPDKPVNDPETAHYWAGMARKP